MGTGLGRDIRTIVAGSLMFGSAISASVLIGAPPASAAAVVQTITVGSKPYAISSDGTHVWVGNVNSNDVTELNALTGAVVQTIAVGSEPYALSSDGTHVWVANAGGNTVTELNASTGAVVQTIAVGSPPYGVSSDGTHVWVANGTQCDRAQRLDGRCRPDHRRGRKSRRRLIGRQPRLGGECRWRNGERAQRLDGRCRSDHHRGYPIPTASRRTAPTSGWRMQVV